MPIIPPPPPPTNSVVNLWLMFGILWLGNHFTDTRLPYTSYVREKLDKLSTFINTSPRKLRVPNRDSQYLEETPDNPQTQEIQAIANKIEWIKSRLDTLEGQFRIIVGKTDRPSFPLDPMSHPMVIIVVPRISGGD